MTWVKRHALGFYALLAFCYLLLPIAVVVLFSFNAPSGRYNYVWEGFTLDNWLEWDSVPGIRSAVVKSLEIGIVSTVAATAARRLIPFVMVAPAPPCAPTDGGSATRSLQMMDRPAIVA